jgi:glycosyltransferase involved in cell wall biosynthesis
LARTPASRTPARLFWKAVRRVLLLPAFVWAVCTCDVFVLGYGSTFGLYWDLPILRLLRKKIIYVFHGSDSRPAYLDGHLMAPDRGLTISQCIRLARKQKRTVRAIERYADTIISHPLSSHFHERPIVNLLSLGIPHEIAQEAVVAPREGRESQVRVLHSPSHPAAKGTDTIVEMVQGLRERQSPIEFIMITNQPNAVVLQALRECDFVVDQLYSDTPMAGFASEAAFLGRPAVVGGYATHELARLLPADSIPPVCYTHPDAANDAIERLVRDSTYRLQLGASAQKFVRSYWAPRRVAERYLQIIHGPIPAAWLCDPREIRYTHGVGMPAARARDLIGAVLRAGGRAALQLGDKPALEQLVIDFAQQGMPGDG